MKSEWVYLRHILDEIEFVQSMRTTMTYEDLTNDTATEHAITRSLEIIGEATKNIPEPLKKEYPRDTMA